MNEAVRDSSIQHSHFCVCVKFVDRSGSESNLSGNVPGRQGSEFESDSSGVKESDSEVTNLSVGKINK